jgi:putative addiction module component (TIGR02574 family)
MIARDEIVQQALSLSPADRLYVADALEQSLASNGFATPEIAAAWADEIERRIAAHEQGGMPAAEVETALERMRRQIAEHRARKVTS